MLLPRIPISRTRQPFSYYLFVLGQFTLRYCPFVLNETCCYFSSKSQEQDNPSNMIKFVIGQFPLGCDPVIILNC